MAEGPAVLLGGPQDGRELTPQYWAEQPVIFVAQPAVLSLALPGPEELYPTAALPPRGVYSAPWVDGGWSRDDAGRLRLEWRGWGRG